MVVPVAVGDVAKVSSVRLASPIVPAPLMLPWLTSLEAAPPVSSLVLTTVFLPLWVSVIVVPVARVTVPSICSVVARLEPLSAIVPPVRQLFFTSSSVPPSLALMVAPVLVTLLSISSVAPLFAGSVAFASLMIAFVPVLSTSSLVVPVAAMSPKLSSVRLASPIVPLR